ncbi:hypothetical protein ACEWY4_023615 [Coilia grayii]|uniref:Complement component C9 n=1 Tax=Coilia grayii TaxID=363190 RepID=A0ABD1J3R0_9TELE
MPCCVAYGCGTKPQKEKRLHHFPRDPKRRKPWESKVRRKHWKPNMNSFLCEDHFDEGQYESHRADGMRRLKPNAVPTRFVFTPLKHPDKPTQRRRKVEDEDQENVDGWGTVRKDHSYSSPSPFCVVQPVPTRGGVSKGYTNSTHLISYTFLQPGAYVNTSRGETGRGVWYGDVSQLPPPTVGTFKTGETAEQNYKNTNKKFRAIQEVVSDRVGDDRARRRRYSPKDNILSPQSINCKMSTWSNWGPCDPCSQNMHRSRSVELFGQFGGASCIHAIGDRRPCQTQAACEKAENPPCLSTEFQCDSGQCVKKRLMCNGDNDCGDWSDEDVCEETGRRPCGNTDLVLSEISRTAGYGINILGLSPRMNPFNNEYFNGLCSRVRDTTTLQYHRLPWNVGVLTYDTKVEETASKEIYENTHSLLREMVEDSSQTSSIGLTFKLSPTEKINISGKVDINVENKKTEMIKEITEHTTTKQNSFMRVKGTVQLGTYRMRSSNVMLSESFLEDVEILPVQYEKGQYFRFLEDYGTHYTSNGKYGGEYELIYILNTDGVKQKKITERMLQDCVKIGVTLEFTIFDASHKHDGCSKFSSLNNNQTEGKALVDSIMASVRGGTVDTAAAMRTKIEKDGLLDTLTYEAWAKSIINAPTLIHSDPEPIYNLIPLKTAHSHEKRNNLRLAIDDYVAEYSVCKCKPCMNGGTVIQMDGKCLCLCPPQYEGLACEKHRSDQARDNKPVVQEGNWSCWSAWSSCSGGKHSRTRKCNTEGLSNASCPGETVSEDYC